MMNHLWQSTLFAAFAGLFTLALRNNRARLSYWIWLAASVKFLIPFSLLVELGSRIEWRQAEAPAAVSFVFERVNEALTPMAAPVLPSPQSRTGEVMIALWALGVLAVAVSWLVRWRRAAHADRVLEPGVFGLFRPELRLPDKLDERLTTEQLNAVLAHELCHVRYRDNLTASIHMLVEALFWFHPLVWWIGARLIDERERACDEEVLRQGHDSEAYAEGILRVCKLYVESPVKCVAGVTGSNLKQRIETILEHRMTHPLTFAKRALLTIAASSVVAGPFLVGLWNAPLAVAQAPAGPGKTFAVATIKPSAPGIKGGGAGLTLNGEFRAMNATLLSLVSSAYTGEPIDLGRVSGGPSWVKSEHFDIEAKADGFLKPSELPSMLQALLADRFKLKVHEETKQLPVFALVLADKNGKLGPNMHPAPADEAAFCDALEKQSPETEPGRGKDGFNRCGGSGRGGIRLRANRISGLNQWLAELLGRPVIDKTGLTGRYDVDLLGELNWDHIVEGGPPDNVANAALVTALQDQLGLKIESTRGPVKTYVIDSASRPSEN